MAYVVLGAIPPGGALVEEAEALGGVQEGGQQQHRVLQHRGALTRYTVNYTCHVSRYTCPHVSCFMLHVSCYVTAHLLRDWLERDWWQAWTGPQYILSILLAILLLYCTDQLSTPPLKLRLSSCLFALLTLCTMCLVPVLEEEDGIMQYVASSLCGNIRKITMM